MGGKRSGVHPINRSLERLYRRRDETSRKRGNHWDKLNQHVKTPKRCDAPYIVTNTQEGKVRVKRLPPTVAQKNGNDFQIIFNNISSYHLIQVSCLKLRRLLLSRFWGQPTSLSG